MIPAITSLPSQSSADESINAVQTGSLSLHRETPDIEHAPVENDPRLWTRRYKYAILFLISGASMVSGLGVNIYNPSIPQIKSQLHASDQQMSLTLSLYILLQGSVSLIWSTLCEIKGRKWIYLISFALSLAGCIGTALAKTVGMLIGMRCIQSAGNSSVLTLGAATLSDIFDPAERGTIMGIYYTAPLIGPSLGPLIGGALAQVSSWRATFWFLTGCVGTMFLSFLFFQETFRKERSLTYQAILTRTRKEQAAAVHDSRKRDSIQASTNDGNAEEKDAGTPTSENSDVEAQHLQSLKDVKITLTDFNPAVPIWLVLRRVNNIVILLSSGVFFAFTYCVPYTCSLTLAAKYNYNALEIGLVLLSFGIGSIFGSVTGGRYSDYMLTKLKEENNGKSDPEMRLRSIKHAMFFLPPCVVAYGWFAEKHLHIASVCIALCAAGFLLMIIYASALTYIVDANVGRSSSAVAANSSIRGFSAFIATEIAVPVQNGIGEGGMYTVFAAAILIAELLILLVAWKGGKWREDAEKSEQI